MEGKFFKKSYIEKRLRKKKFRRKCILGTTIISLFILSIGSLYSIDLNIRNNMLPNAKPIFAVNNDERLKYDIYFFGKEISFDFGYVEDFFECSKNIINTPTALERCKFIAKGYFTKNLPYNLRENINQKNFY